MVHQKKIQRDLKAYLDDFLGKSNSGTRRLTNTDSPCIKRGPPQPPSSVFAFFPTPQKMQSLLFTLSALLALAAVHAAPQGSQPSNVPTCTFSCPPQDQLGFNLGVHSDDGTNLFCSYPALDGEDPNDFFCRYSDVSNF